jgi:peptide/nickel transport system permease protein
VSRYIVGRVVAIIPTMLVLLTFVVVIVRLLPGNAVDLMLQDQVKAKGTSHAALEQRLGLDKPVPVELVRYSLSALHGDLGRSVWSRQPVSQVIGDRIGVTLELSFWGMVFAAATGISIGVISAVSQNSPADYLLRSVSVLGLSIPNFALATVIIVLPTIWWGWSPSLIYAPPSAGLWRHISQFFIPAAVLAVGSSAALMRITRTMMLEVLRLDYIRTARAKGLSGRSVILRHALRNAMIPVISLLGIQAAVLLSGVVIAESVFALPGIGRTLIQAIATRDYPVVQGVAVVTGLLVIVINLAVDLSYGLLDPRVKVS